MDLDDHRDGDSARLRIECDVLLLEGLHHLLEHRRRIHLGWLRFLLLALTGHRGSQEQKGQ